MKFSIAAFYIFIAESASEKVFKSVNISQNCGREGGLHVDDREEKQFPVTLMARRSFCGWCCTDTVKISQSANSTILISPAYQRRASCLIMAKPIFVTRFNDLGVQSSSASRLLDGSVYSTTLT